MKKLNLIKLTVLFLCVSFFTSCYTVSYAPFISLDVSPVTIKKCVMVEKFVDKSPDRDKENRALGFSLTNEEALANELAVEVTNAVVADFSNNRVFDCITRKIDEPDLIMKGEIRKFKGYYGYTKFGIISLCTIVPIVAWYFGAPIQKNETEMELVITIHNPQGELLGTYTGKYTKTKKASMYKNMSAAIFTLTNQSFSKAVSKIREQIMEDINKFN